MSKYVMCPLGYAVNLEFAETVTPVEIYTDAKTQEKSVRFTVHLNSERKELFIYYCDNYTDTTEELCSKVNSIRSQMLLMMNDGKPVTEINGSINLKK